MRIVYDDTMCHSCGAGVVVDMSKSTGRFRQSSCVGTGCRST